MEPQAETANLLDGRKTARDIRGEVAEGCAALSRQHGIVPGLSVVLVGENPASRIYVRNKQKAAREAGMNSNVIELPVSSPEARVIEVVEGLNRDPAVHGILVQLPLPDQVDSRKVIETIDPSKDVDGFHPINSGRLLSGLPGLVPCTPAGIIELLERHEIPFAGQHAVVIGRSNIVGKPLAVLLLRKNCTVTVCHSKTRNLPEVASSADILVAAIGRRAMVTGDFIKPGAVVVDVGMNVVEDESTCRSLFGDNPKRLKAVRERGSTLVGDVHPLDARSRAGWFTPVPGGVGPLTIALLLRNTLLAARAAAENRRS